MKIKKVELKNFKFHKSLDFEITKRNCLIYGENGTGKSSIYEALYSVFKSYFRNNSFDFKKFKTNNSSDELSVKVLLEDNELTISNSNEDYSLPVNISQENKKTIYFANQDLLESLIGDESNFYLVIENKLRKYFEKLNKLYEEQEDKKNRIKFAKLELFLKEVSTEANKIIDLSFEEEFIISFQTTFHEYDFIKDEYIKPFIKLQIDEKNKLKLNFNEAKLKLTSIAIFFALIKLEEGENNTNPLKLLVLDDFLTSLDMANRHYIIEYIFKEFKEYQKIILTHNLQFYNLIVKLLKSKDDDSWNIKNIYLRDNNKAIINDKNENYLQKAEEKLNSYDLEVSGNYQRKEFERIVEEFEKLLEIGRVEELSNILTILKNLDKIVINPSKTINLSLNILNNHDTTDEEKFTQIQDNFTDIESQITYKNLKLSYLKQLISNTEFYKNIIMNPASHDDTEKELYQKEFRNSIKVLKKLQKTLEDLKS